MMPVELLFDVSVLFEVPVLITVALVESVALVVLVDIDDPSVLELPLEALVAAADEAEAEAEGGGVPGAEAAVADATVLELSITKYGLKFVELGSLSETISIL